MPVALSVRSAIVVIIDGGDFRLAISSKEIIERFSKKGLNRGFMLCSEHPELGLDLLGEVTGNIGFADPSGAEMGIMLLWPCGGAGVAAAAGAGHGVADRAAVLGHGFWPS